MARSPPEVDDDEMVGVPGRPRGIPGVDFLVKIPEAVIVQTIREMARVRGAVSVTDVPCETGADPDREWRVERRRHRAPLFVRR